MKNLWKLLFVIPLAICLSAEARAQGTQGTGGKLGVGMVFGEPTGFSWKYRIDQINAVDGAIGVAPDDRFRMHVDYLWQTHPFNEQRLMLHYGPGFAIGGGNDPFSDEDVGFAVRGAVGLDYQIKQTPLELYFEVAPMVIMTPIVGSGLDLGFGGRFFL